MEHTVRGTLTRSATAKRLEMFAEWPNQQTVFPATVGRSSAFSYGSSITVLSRPVCILTIAAM